MGDFPRESEQMNETQACKIHGCKHFSWPSTTQLSRLSHCILGFLLLPRSSFRKYYLSTSVGQFLEWGTDTCRLSTWVYTHLPTPLKKNTHTHTQELARESLVLCQFLHDNLQCFKVFEIMGIVGSLILNFSK
jgi:hypothetical protein